MKIKFSELTKKVATVATASLNMFVSREAIAKPTYQAIPQVPAINEGVFRNKILRPKLTLRLNVNEPAKSLLAYHSSHSSHASHASHSSHSSGGYGNSSDDGGGMGLGVLAVGGIAAYGIYRATRKKQ